MLVVLDGIGESGVKDCAGRLRIGCSAGCDTPLQLYPRNGGPRRWIRAAHRDRLRHCWQRLRLRLFLLLGKVEVVGKRGLGLPVLYRIGLYASDQPWDV